MRAASLEIAEVGADADIFVARILVPRRDRRWRVDLRHGRSG